jgi:hypothetical protein
MASASSLLFDRGLPVADLNNAAGALRSNVSWADNFPLLVGDDFTLGGSGDYFVDTLRVWVVGADLPWTLWFGAAGGLITQLPGSPTSTVTTYADASTYQGTSGNFTTIRQLDFSLNQTLNGATTYRFFLGGPSGTYAFLHSSNAALSGATEQGADNLMLEFNMAWGSVSTFNSNGNGWDKSSDGNIQVFGNAVGFDPQAADAVPEPATLALFGTGLALIARKLRSRQS